MSDNAPERIWISKYKHVMLPFTIKSYNDDISYILASVADKREKELGDKLDKIIAVIKEYYKALDNREHGGVAQNRAFNRIEYILDMYWGKDEELEGELDG